MIMVNKEQKQKDGFGLPSTDVRKKDNKLEVEAAIKDMVAKWNAYQESLKEPVVKEVVEEIIEPVVKVATEKELKALEDEKKAILKAKADKVAELKKALAEAEKE